MDLALIQRLDQGLPRQPDAGLHRLHRVQPAASEPTYARHTMTAVVKPLRLRMASEACVRTRHNG